MVKTVKTVEPVQTIEVVRNGWRRIIAEESGQDLIEYALVCALLGLASVVFLKTFSTVLSNLIITMINKGAAAWPQ